MGEYSDDTAYQNTCWLYDPTARAGFDFRSTKRSASGHTVL